MYNPMRNISVLQVRSTSLANFLVTSEPRGAGAEAGAFSCGGVFSLGWRVLACCEFRCPRPLAGGRPPRSAFDSEVTMGDRKM
jgi:hypothetical protein